MTFLYARFMKQRLQKLIAGAGLASRRKAEEWIANGRVTINGEIAELGAQADPGKDRILVDGRPLPQAEEPVVCLCTNRWGMLPVFAIRRGVRL